MVGKTFRRKNAILIGGFLISFFLSIIAIPRSWGAMKTVSEGLCEKLLSRVETGSPSNVSEVRKHLTESGFRRIGKSDHFLFGKIIIEIVYDGTVRIYFEMFFWPADHMERDKITPLSAARAVLAILPRRYGSPDIIDVASAEEDFPKQALQLPEAKGQIEDILEADLRAGKS